MALIDQTHDPSLRSWVASANEPGCDFPIQNLPFATFSYQRRQRIGAAIGDFVLDLAPWLDGSDLSGFFRLSSADRVTLRNVVSRALQEGSAPREIYAARDCRFLPPAAIGDYTDFYASVHHARNIGALFRPDNPLLPNYTHIPIAYHGRASSVVVSGARISRPCGQLGRGKFGPTAELDYEVELGGFVGRGNSMGEPIPIAEADNHLVGLCLLNDWSARDIQRWEYQPLGPFLAKNFATTISPWVVTSECLAPFRVPAPAENRVELPYLRLPSANNSAIDVTVEAWLQPVNHYEPIRLSHARFRDMYWTFAQMIAHHTVNGCPLRPADLIGSGTISGPEKWHRGCLLELTMGGREPVVLPDGSTRSFLADGDEVTLLAWCEREGFRRIGFGRCSGKIRGRHHI